MRFLFAAGGTGGTVIPGIVIAQELRASAPEAQVLFVGTPRGMETELVPKAGFPLELVKVGGLKRKKHFERFKNLVYLPMAFWSCSRLLARFSPAAVFGTGGYASGPLLLVASLRRIRTAILEPNSVPGFANRVLGRFVDRIFVAFEEAISRLPAKKCLFSGNPIRPDILDVPPPAFDGEERTVLIFGGSQGAKRLNEAVMAALETLKSDRSRIRFLHQTGPQDEARVREAYEANGFRAEVFAFREDMASLYRRSDIVIARSGSSVLEIAATGRPSILVPYPHAADDHQLVNATVMVEAGASVRIEDSRCTGETLASELLGMIRNRERLDRMSRSALKLRRADAARIIASEFLKMGFV